MLQRRTREPLRGRRRQVLLEEGLTVHTIGPTLTSTRSTDDMRKHDGGDTGVVVDDFGLRGAALGVEDLAQIGHGHGCAVESDLTPIRRCHFLIVLDSAVSG